MTEQALAGGRTISLPMSKALEISLRSLKIRFGRSLITTSGIILAIAFLMSVWSSNEIIGGLRNANKSDINLLLQKNGIVRSIRGAHGGYQLAKDPEKLTILTIMTAIEGPVQLIDCLAETEACNNEKRCSTRGLWKGLEDSINSYLKSNTLQELIENFQESNKGFQGMYI